MKKQLSVVAFLFSLLMCSSVFAQVTTSAINGIVTDQNGQPLPGATVLLLHEPTGTRYGTTTRADGRYSIANVRVGGPYTLKFSYVGYSENEVKNITLTLAQELTINGTLSEQATLLGELQVTAVTDALINGDRTGAATTIDTRNIQQLPTISRRISDFTRLTPQASGNSFAGFDNRLNNITVDGSSFNNSFGLGGQPGDRTGVAPISIDAIEQISVNIAPYDVRQGGFVGAGVNTVTKSGTNTFKGTVYTQARNNNMVGTKARTRTFDPGEFSYNQLGFALGGPIIKDKLFFFSSFEVEQLVQPGTTYRANNGTETAGGNVTRVLASDLDSLSSFLRRRFNYETGPYQGYDNETPATRLLLKFDYNINDRNKLNVRFTNLNSNTDVLLSNSSSLGFGNRRTSIDALNFQNSNYQIKENIRSVVGEWNSSINNSMSNNLIVGYTYQDESRASRGSFFPFVDILKDGVTYTSFGFEPFTPNNELRYKTFQIQNNFIVVAGAHTMTFGFSGERYESENVFFPGSQSVYVYNSLNDFYSDALAYLNNTPSSVTVRRFQVRYSNIPGLKKPVQPLKVTTIASYAQDEWKVSSGFKLTAGIRFDTPVFENTGFRNPQVDTLNFRDENGNTVRYKTDKMPDPKTMISPRIGFNWDVTGNKTTQVRGGTGVFTGRPAYVWISNQIGNNGVLTGFEQRDNTTIRRFNPDPDFYKPTTVTGAPASSYELALTDPNFRFPQVWRSNLAIDQKLPFLDLVATAEVLYSRELNGIYYINANLRDSTGSFKGADQRRRWVGSNRINSMVTSAVVLKNQNVGEAMNVSFSLERPFKDGIFAKIGYNYGVSRNTVDPGSIAFGSWNNNQHAGDPNNPGVGYSVNRAGHRIFAAASVQKDFFKFGATTFSFFYEGRNNGTATYTFSGDLNGDGGTANDLIYVPKDLTEMNFQEYTITVNGAPRTFTAAQQAEAWNAYINQDPYLKNRRGKYAERNGVLLPFVHRIDFSLSQDIAPVIKGRKHAFQLRWDILNFGNLLNKNWGVGQTLISNTPLIVPTNAQGGPADAQGRARYRMRAINGELMTKSYQYTANIDDVWRMQVSLRYTF
jgi:hypothetical protein